MLEGVKIVSSQMMLDPKHFLVNYSIGNLCNYDCSYCWPGSKSGTHPHREVSFHKEFIDELVSQIKQRGFDKLTILFTGGEPTVYKPLPELIAHFVNSYDIECNVVINTNLSAPIKYYEKLKTLASKANSFFIMASFHRDHTTAEEFIPKAQKLKQLGYNVATRQVVEPHVFDYCLENVEKFKKAGLFLDLKIRIHPGRGLEGKRPFLNYTDEMLSTLEGLRDPEGFDLQKDFWPYDIRLIREDQSQKVIINEIDLFNNLAHNFTGWKCTAGMNHIGVSSDGNIVRCWDIKGPGNSLGNVFDKDFKLPDDNVICPVGWCTSCTGVQIPKERI